MVSVFELSAAHRWGTVVKSPKGQKGSGMHCDTSNHFSIPFATAIARIEGKIDKIEGTRPPATPRSLHPVFFPMLELVAIPLMFET